MMEIQEVPREPPATHNGWITIHNVDIPFIVQKQGKKLVPVKMLEKYILSYYPSQLPEQLQNVPPLACQAMNQKQVDILSDLAVYECFTVRDPLVNIDHFMVFLTMLKQAYPDVSPPVLEIIDGGWIVLADAMIPHVDRDGKRCLPIDIIRGATDLFTDTKVDDTFLATADEVALLNKLCKDAGLDFVFLKDTSLLLLSYVKECYPDRPVTYLRKGTPHGTMLSAFTETKKELEIPLIQHPEQPQMSHETNGLIAPGARIIGTVRPTTLPYDDEDPPRKDMTNQHSPTPIVIAPKDDVTKNSLNALHNLVDEAVQAVPPHRVALADNGVTSNETNELTQSPVGVLDMAPQQPFWQYQVPSMFQHVQQPYNFGDHGIYQPPFAAINHYLNQGNSSSQGVPLQPWNITSRTSSQHPQLTSQHPPSPVSCARKALHQPWKDDNWEGPLRQLLTNHDQSFSPAPSSSSSDQDGTSTQTDTLKKLSSVLAKRSRARKSRHNALQKFSIEVKSFLGSKLHCIARKSPECVLIPLELFHLRFFPTYSLIDLLNYIDYSMAVPLFSMKKGEEEELVRLLDTGVEHLRCNKLIEFSLAERYFSQISSRFSRTETMSSMTPGRNQPPKSSALPSSASNLISSDQRDQVDDIYRYCSGDLHLSWGYLENCVRNGGKENAHIS